MNPKVVKGLSLRLGNPFEKVGANDPLGEKMQVRWNGKKQGSYITAKEVQAGGGGGIRKGRKHVNDASCYMNPSRKRGGENMSSLPFSKGRKMSKMCFRIIQGKKDKKRVKETALQRRKQGQRGDK